MLLSFRYLVNDQFWFTVLHEAGHLLPHSRQRLFLEGFESPDAKVRFIIEAAERGLSLIYFMKAEHMSVFHRRPRDDKVARVARVLPIFEQGRVFLVGRPDRDAWIESLVNEFLSFPNGRYDDQVDGVSQALIWAEPRVNSRTRVTVCG